MSPSHGEDCEDEALIKEAFVEDEDAKIIFAFVVFKSMEGVRLLQTAFSFTYWERVMVKICCCCCFRKRRKIQ